MGESSFSNKIGSEFCSGLGTCIDKLDGSVGNIYDSWLAEYEETCVSMSCNLRENNNISSDHGENCQCSKVWYNIEWHELRKMQDSNFAMRMLKSKVRNAVSSKKWVQRPLRQFKRVANKLNLSNGVLIYGDSSQSPVVASFPFIIEIISKTHLALNHIGCYKLMNVIKPHFWHPGLEKVIRDYTRSCSHCQLFKNNRHEKIPPIVKIKAEFPYELVSVDLLQFPRSQKGNVALLVFIEHYSKWTTAVPIPNKTSLTVASALKNRILPNLLRIPFKLLSDNGPEFGAEFRNVLREYNIKHQHSSPYHPAGNGRVERVNQTFIQLLKAADKPNKWDENISQALITYNNTFHREVNDCPAHILLNVAHELKSKPLLNSNVLDSWKEGHPNFCSFKVGQKVCKKIHRVGNLLSDKLNPRYAGPFIIKTVFSNGVSYEITKEGEPLIWKVNHRQLKAWHDVPFYIQKYLTLHDSLPDHEDDDLGSLGSHQHRYFCSSSDSSGSSDDSDNESVGSLNKVGNLSEIGDFKPIIKKNLDYFEKETQTSDVRVLNVDFYDKCLEIWNQVIQSYQSMLDQIIEMSTFFDACPISESESLHSRCSTLVNAQSTPIRRIQILGNIDNNSIDFWEVEEATMAEASVKDTPVSSRVPSVKSSEDSTSDISEMKKNNRKHVNDLKKLIAEMKNMVEFGLNVSSTNQLSRNSSLEELSKTPLEENCEVSSAVSNLSQSSIFPYDLRPRTNVNYRDSSSSDSLV